MVLDLGKVDGGIVEIVYDFFWLRLRPGNLQIVLQRYFVLGSNEFVVSS